MLCIRLKNKINISEQLREEKSSPALCVTLNQ